MGKVKPLGLIGKKKIDILHTPSEDILEIDREIRELSQRMYATLKVHSGYAIAAVQVGIPINLVVLDSGESYINIKVSGDETEGSEFDIEACLSLPGKRFNVERWRSIHFNGTSLDGDFFYKKMNEFEARMWQHEYDHIQGRLLSD